MYAQLIAAKTSKYKAKKVISIHILFSSRKDKIIPRKRPL